jgi:hypothetical protein
MTRGSLRSAGTIRADVAPLHVREEHGVDARSRLRGYAHDERGDGNERGENKGQNAAARHRNAPNRLWALGSGSSFEYSAGATPRASGHRMLRRDWDSAPDRRDLIRKKTVAK